MTTFPNSPRLLKGGIVLMDIRAALWLKSACYGATDLTGSTLSAARGDRCPIPDVRIMLSVDLMKFKPSDLRRQLESIF